MKDKTQDRDLLTSKPADKKRRNIFLAVFFITATLLLGGLLVRYNIFILKRAAIEAGRIDLEKYRVQLVKWFTFHEKDALKEWDEKILKGRVVYTVDKDAKGSFVHAKSDKTASALYYRIKLDARKKTPVVKWKWNVNTFPVKKMPESLETTDEDDFAARVYLIFTANFITNSKVVEYVWAETLPEGKTGISPYSDNIRLMVLRSGLKKDKPWCLEERDVVEDYVKLFGERPRHDIGAVAFMTDADTTGTSADSVYTDIKLGYKEEDKGKKAKQSRFAKF